MADHSKALLTEDQVEEWKKEEARLEGEISACQQKLSTVRRKLAAVAIITADILDGDVVIEVPSATLVISNEDSLPPMPAAIMEIVQRIEAPFSPAELRRELAEVGYARKRLGNYFYTVLHRLVERGSLAKVGKRYVLIDPADLSLPENEEASSDTPREGPLDASSVETGLPIQ